MIAYAYVLPNCCPVHQSSIKGTLPTLPLTYWDLDIFNVHDQFKLFSAQVFKYSNELELHTSLPRPVSYS